VRLGDLFATYSDIQEILCILQIELIKMRRCSAHDVSLAEVCRFYNEEIP